MQKRRTVNHWDLTLPIIKKAQENLLSPQEFYRLCQQVKDLQGIDNLYFLLADLSAKKSLVKTEEICIFFDYLAEKIQQSYPEKFPVKFYLEKILLKFKKGYLSTFQARIKINQRRKLCRERVTQLSVEVVGEGMIGRVAKVRLNEGEDLAFKVFFDSSLVWQHGFWGEIPVALYLQAHQVTKNLPRFKCAAQTWAVWEWIYPETTPDSRPGITYEEFAKQQGLTALNYLNRNNYNPYDIRLDLGGIQKEYLGRRWHDFVNSIRFYHQKIRREGLLFFKNYLTINNIFYFSLRLIFLIFVNPIKAKFRKGFRPEWTFLKASK
ncbi:hypothetical protein [Gloeothece verrucosa]|uniref:Uncharacterized protein n=1 Tax=Gloeothece verrucosa (strain PCC 7822) TaxID=497965 RepID=E0UDS2_GLOV7|nr:hypothetical protein [Gloeothece verrucosa]ADN16507.1 hypothetical protein Cyan7822_4599 [Gloeothece verrucosa PCC 7822]